MTERFKELERELAKLPEAKREQWVSHFLEELSANEEEANGEVAIQREWIGGRRPTQEEVDEAVTQLREFRKGKTLGDDITIKELINEGRRY